MTYCNTSPRKYKINVNTKTAWRLKKSHWGGGWYGQTPTDRLLCLYITASRKKVGGRSKKKSQGSDDEAGEETDEGDMESREVDYMSDSSSDSEQEFQVSTSHVIVM